MKLNERLIGLVTQKGNHVVWHAPDRSVRLPSIATANAILDRIDAVNRSPVSHKVLTFGIINRRDDRSTAQRGLDDTKLYRSEDYPDTWWSPSPDNPHAQSIADLDASRPQRKTIRDQVREDYQREAEAWEEQQSAPPGPPKEPNPKRLMQAAERYLVATYVNVPVTVFRQTAAMLDAAEVNDGSTYSALHREWAAAEQARIAAADNELAVEQARIMADRNAIGDADFEFETPATSPANTTPQEETTNDTV